VILIRTFHYGINLYFKLIPIAKSATVTKILSYKYGLDVFCAGLFLGILVSFAISTAVAEKYTASTIKSSRSLISLMIATLSITFIRSACTAIKGFSNSLLFFESCGYSKNFLIFIITIEMLCGVLIWWPKSRKLAMILITADMVGATATHFHNYFSKDIPDPFGNSLPSLSILVFVVFLTGLIKLFAEEQRVELTQSINYHKVDK